MFCMKCGSQLVEGARFCNKCGTPVENAASANAASDAFQSQQTAFMEPEYGAQDLYQQPTTPMQPMQQPTQPMQQPTQQPTQPMQQTTQQPTQPMQQPWGQQPSFQQQDQQSYQQENQQYRQQGYVVPATAQQAPAQKKPKMGLIIGIAAGVVAVAAVLVVLFVWPGVLKGGESSNSPTANAPAASTQQNNGQGTGTASGGSSSSGQSDSTGTQSEPKPDTAPANTFNAAEAESKARQAALDAGKEVFTGTVHLTNMYDRAKEIDSGLAEQFKSSSNVELAVLDLSSPTTIEARSGGDMGKLITRAGGASLSLKDPSTWASYDRKTITVAVHPVDMWYPSDVAGALYTVTAKNVVVIAPLTESTADAAIKDAGTITEDTRQGIKDAEAAAKQDQQQQQQQNTLNDYILPDSSTHAYSRSQLEQMSNHDLFLARNEIYARYGRQFVSQELQDYFGSKSWYHGTVAPNDFNENWLNDTERHNVETMLSIEQDRNSPYI